MTVEDVTEVSETKSLVRPALVLMSGRTLAFAVTFLIPVVLARVFDPAQFGTYKQLFLIFGTVYGVAQMGMTSSLYYFLPLSSRHAGHYVANSLWVLGLAGLGFVGALVVSAPKVAAWLENPALAEYLPWIGLYTFLMMLSASIEIALVTDSHYGWASVWYGLSDLARAVALILPALIFRQLHWLLVGAVGVAFLKALFALVYYFRKYRGRFMPDRALLKPQLAYALPFGFAVLVETLQASLPQYVVAHLFDPATFAFFAVGCLEIPLVEFLVSPTSDLMMVKMQQSLAAGRIQAVVDLWHDTTFKLALLFFPLIGLVMVLAREIIVLIYTDKYLASVPIFMVWSVLTLLVPLQVDGLLRVFAQTRYLLVVNLIRLAVLALLIKGALVAYGLVGVTVVIVLANMAYKVAALARIKVILEIRLPRLLPWRRLGRLLGAAAVAAAVTVFLKSEISNVTGLHALALAAVFVAIYVTLVWCLSVLSHAERIALQGAVRKIRTSLAQSLNLGRA